MNAGAVKSGKAGDGGTAAGNIVSRFQRPVWPYPRGMRYAILVLALILAGATGVQAEQAPKVPAGNNAVSRTDSTGYSSVDADRRAIVVLLLLYGLKTDDRLHEQLRRQVGRHAEQSGPRTRHRNVALND